MNAVVAKPGPSTLLWSALMTLPLLVPGARRRYGTIPVLIGVFGLGSQLYRWLQARRGGPAHELRMAVHDQDVARTPHLRTHLE
jgi:hypothetical protein